MISQPKCWIDYISQFSQDFGMHLMKSHRLTDVQVPQVVTDLIFTYNGRDVSIIMPKAEEHLREGKRKRVKEMRDLM